VRWVHEIKFDGYRVQVHLRDATVKVFTRRGNDWTHRAWHINAGSAIIDGEVVAPANDGTTDSSVLQNGLKGESTGSCWSPSTCSISTAMTCGSCR
jgi:bifunctional non-homologous end joining protein LigD